MLILWLETWKIYIIAHNYTENQGYVDIAVYE